MIGIFLDDETDWSPSYGEPDEATDWLAISFYASGIVGVGLIIVGSIEWNLLIALMGLIVLSVPPIVVTIMICYFQWFLRGDDE